MNTLLKIILLYIPALIGYAISITTLLIVGGYIDNPNEFKPSDYEPVYSTIENGTQITYHELKK